MSRRLLVASKRPKRQGCDTTNYERQPEESRKGSHEVYVVGMALAWRAIMVSVVHWLLTLLAAASPCRQCVEQRLTAGML